MTFYQDNEYTVSCIKQVIIAVILHEPRCNDLQFIINLIDSVDNLGSLIVVDGYCNETERDLSFP